MLTGDRPFQGETITDVLASVVKEEPDLRRVPENLRPLLNACLQKDPKRRLQAIGDWRLLVGQSSRPLQRRPGGLRHWVPWIIAAALALVVVWALWRPATAPAKVMRFQIPLAETASPANPGFALSPDGEKLVYYGRGADGSTRLWLRTMDSLDVRPVVTGASPLPPFWSPDTRWIAYSDAGKLKKVDIDGSPPQTLCNLAEAAPGGSWNRDGVILFGNPSGPIMRVSAAGGVASPVTALEASRKEAFHVFPFFLPDGRHFLYLRGSSVPENSGIFVGSLDAKPEQQNDHRVATSEYGAMFVANPDGKTGVLLLLRENALLAQPFDLSRFDVTGEPVPVASDVGSYNAFGFFSAAANGTLVYRGAHGKSQLTLFDRGGKQSGTVGEPGDFINSLSSFSPDGKQAAVALRNPEAINRANLWLLDLSGSEAPTRFTFDASADADPVWSPDGTQIVFSSSRDGSPNLYRKPANGSREEEPLLKSDVAKYATSWSRNGRFLLYQAVDPKTKADLWILPDPGASPDASQPILFQRTEANEVEARFSPDGRWIVYMSDETGRYEAYVREFVLGPDGKPQATPKHQISTGGAYVPAWRDDGKELIFFAPTGTMSVEISTQPAFRAASPKMLFQLPAFPPVPPAVSPDGKRFLVAMPAAQHGEPFTVVLNFTAGLKR
jgi:Tol biopolymer transport system component